MSRETREIMNCRKAFWPHTIVGVVFVVETRDSDGVNINIVADSSTTRTIASTRGASWQSHGIPNNTTWLHVVITCILFVHKRTTTTSINSSNHHEHHHNHLQDCYILCCDGLIQNRRRGIVGDGIIEWYTASTSLTFNEAVSNDEQHQRAWQRHMTAKLVV